MTSRLREYERKRDAERTPEPFSGGRSDPGAPRFVVQRHDARSLHYDFRLERDGVLASWAVPKGVPVEPGVRHLAVHVEDHPLDYASFEGEIPKGSYGAGTVEIWDSGTYELVEEKRDGGLTVRLHGEHLDGTWTLVPARLSGDEKNWLLMRKRDGPESDGVRHGHAVMLASLARSLPEGPDWRYEVKWDGYRALGYVRGGEARLVSRNGNDLTQRFRTVAQELVKAVRRVDCVVDGEICALDEQGRPSFSAMQQGKAATPLLYAIFDVLEVEGEIVANLPLRERRAQLERLVAPRDGLIRLSESFVDGHALLAAVREQALEGVIAKRDSSVYVEGKRSRDWLKIKTHNRQEFVICGWTRGSGRRLGRFGSLVLGVRRDRELVYVGNCGTGFTDATIDELFAKLRPLEQADPPFASVPKMPKIRKADISWVAPKLVCEVEFVEWTHDGRLRAPSFQGLRDDKPAEQVSREAPIDSAPLPTEVRRGRRVVKLSNLDKLFWPDEGITKGDLLAYYRTVAPVLLPHLRDRPFTMRRYPDGAFGKSFFQKDAPKHMPDWIRRHRVQVTTRDSPRERRWIEAPLVNDELALLWVVNMGCIDMNAWYSRVDRPERPDFVLFDLDPSPDVGWTDTVKVALLVRDALDALELVSFAKTSGSDGIHVLVPIERRSTYEDTRRFAEIVAGALERTHPGLVTTQWVKSKRRGVLIDVNQNGAGKTIASPYSVRPKAGAPVSTPVAWSEMTEQLDPSAFTMSAVLERVRSKGDLFEAVLTTRQRLDRALAVLN